MLNLNKILQSALALLCVFLNVSSVKAGTYHNYDQRFGQLNFHRSILEADCVVVGEVAFVNGNKGNTRTVVQVLNPQLVWGAIPVLETAREMGGAKAPEKGKAVFVLDQERFSMDTAIVPTEQRCLVFLKKAKPDETLAKSFGLEPDTVFYEVCSGWQSAIVPEFENPVWSLKAIKLLHERYAIDNEAALLKAITDLSAWRDLKDKDGKEDKPKQIEILLNLLNANKDAKIYTDNVPPLLFSLGMQASLKDGTWVIEQAPPPRKRDTSFKPGVLLSSAK